MRDGLGNVRMVVPARRLLGHFGVTMDAQVACVTAMETYFVGVHLGIGFVS